MKLIEAGAQARPMVATKLAAEGLAHRDESEIILREDDEAIAAACIRVLTDDSLATRIGAGARRLTEQEYSEEVVQQIIVQKLSSTA
jgi:glycosyltransferase involved in cell wall biosynthesis